MIAESSALFPASAWIRSTLTKTTQTHNQWIQSQTRRFCSLSFPLGDSEPTVGPLWTSPSTRTIQPSRCCLSGPAANTAWWGWHHSAWLPPQPTHAHTQITHFPFLSCILFHTLKPQLLSYYSIKALLYTPSFLHSLHAICQDFAELH